MPNRLTPEDLAKSHGGLCGVSIGDGACSCLVQWVEGLQKDLDAALLQNEAHKKVLDGIVFFWTELKAATAANVPSGEFREDDDRGERVRVAELNLRVALDRIVPVSLAQKR